MTIGKSVGPNAVAFTATVSTYGAIVNGTEIYPAKIFVIKGSFDSKAAKVTLTETGGLTRKAEWYFNTFGGRHLS